MLNKKHYKLLSNSGFTLVQLMFTVTIIISIMIILNPIEIFKKTFEGSSESKWTAQLSSLTKEILEFEDKSKLLYEININSKEPLYSLKVISPYLSAYKPVEKLIIENNYSVGLTKVQTGGSVTVGSTKPITNYPSGYYLDGEGYSGELEEYLVSGSLIPGSGIKEHKVTNRTGVFESTITVGGVKLSLEGPPKEVLISGSIMPPHTKTVTDQPSMDYSDADGYEGKLDRYLHSGSLSEVDTKNVTKVEVSSKNDFTGTISHTEGEYSGILSKTGALGVTWLSGDYIPPETKQVENQPTSDYNQGGFSGFLTKYTTGGVAPLTKSVSDSTTSTSNSFSSTKTYSSGGYTGTLSKSGSSTSSQVQTGGSYTPSDSKTVTGQTSSYYNSGGYSGTLSSYLYSGSYTSADSKSATTTQSMSFSTYTSYLNAYGKDAFPTSKSYSSGGYSGTLYPTRQYLSSDAETIYVDYGGTVTKPASDTRVYRYKGTVNRPETDTRTYTTNYTQVYSGTVSTVDTRTFAYKGTVTKPEVDNRVFEFSQTYSGNLVKGEKDTRVYRFQGEVTKPEQDNRLIEYTQNYTGSSDEVDTRVFKYRGTVTKPGIDTRTFTYTQGYINELSSTPNAIVKYITNDTGIFPDHIIDNGIKLIKPNSESKYLQYDNNLTVSYHETNQTTIPILTTYKLTDYDNKEIVETNGRRFVNNAVVMGGKPTPLSDVTVNGSVGFEPLIDLKVSNIEESIFLNLLGARKSVVGKELINTKKLNFKNVSGNSIEVSDVLKMVFGDTSTFNAEYDVSDRWIGLTPLNQKAIKELTTSKSTLLDESKYKLYWVSNIVSEEIALQISKDNLFKGMNASVYNDNKDLIKEVYDIATDNVLQNSIIVIPRSDSDAIKSGKSNYEYLKLSIND